MIPFSDIEYVLRNPELGGDTATSRVDVGDLVDALEKLYDICVELHTMIAQNAPLANPNPNAVQPGDHFFDPQVLTDTEELIDESAAPADPEDPTALELTLAHLDAAYTPADPANWSGYVTFNDVLLFSYSGSWQVYSG